MCVCMCVCVCVCVRLCLCVSVAIAVKCLVLPLYAEDGCCTNFLYRYYKTIFSFDLKKTVKVTVSYISVYY